MYSMFLTPSHSGGLIPESFIVKVSANLKPCVQSVLIPQDSSPVPHILTNAPWSTTLLGEHNSALMEAIPNVSPHTDPWGTPLCKDCQLDSQTAQSILYLPLWPHLQLSLNSWVTKEQRVWETVPKSFPGYPSAPSDTSYIIPWTSACPVGWAICTSLLLCCGYCFTPTGKGGRMYCLQSWKEINESSQIFCRFS